MLWFISGLALADPTPYVTADGMDKLVFPAAAPDRPGGFILFHDNNLFAFGLMTWAKEPQRYYEGSRTLRLLEPGVSVRPFIIAALSLPLKSANSLPRSRLLQRLSTRATCLATG